MCHVWPDIVVRGVGGTAVVRTRQLVKDARPVYALAYNGVYEGLERCAVSNELVNSGVPRCLIFHL